MFCADHTCSIYIYTGADPGGGGQGGLAPPPFWGEKTRGPKTRTQKKKIKIGQPRSKIQAKTYPKTH